MRNGKRSSHRFSITFWMRARHNPAWRCREGWTQFPPLQVNGLRLLCEKRGPVFTVYLLTPRLDGCQLSADLARRLGRDTFVAVTCKKERAVLYLDGEAVDEQRTAPRLPVFKKGAAAGSHSG